MLDREIEAILYYKNEPVSVKKLGSITGRDQSEVREALDRLRERLLQSGLALISKDDEVMLGTAPDLSPVIEKIAKDDLTTDLGKASLDTLTIILYYGPVSKAQIDNIRGVNSSSILRNLLIRGLVERATNENDQRSYLYKPTFDLLSYLGIKGLKELPEYQELRQAIDQSLKIVEFSDNESVNTEAQD